ncbi:MAG: M14 family zinc carboxypeptidase, partial [Myxococcota bacterium]
VNPDGVANRSRYNDRNVDLNRNYGFEWDPTEFRPGDRPFSESETRAVRALSAAVSFGAGLSVHSGATNLGWVWNYTTERSPDEDLLSSIADGYSDSCSTPGFWLTNGADWYVTNGDTTDWSYGRHGTLDYTLEVSNTKSPNADEMDRVVSQHEEAVITWMDWPLWIAGQVVDETTGLGIPASIHLDDSTPAIQSGPSGMFSRPVERDALVVDIHSPGYRSTSVELNAFGEATLIALEPSEIVEDVITGRLADSSNEFILEVSATEVELSRPGEPSFLATPVSGGWSVPAHTQAGVWNLRIDGQVAPRALFIAEHSGRVEVNSIRVDDDTVEIAGTEFGRGSQVWAFWGTHRVPVPVPILSQSTSNIILNGSALPIEEETIDLLLWSKGEQVAVVDILDMIEPGEDVPDSDDPSDPDDPPDTQDPDGETGGSSSSGELPDEQDDFSHSSAKLNAGGCSVSPRYPYRYVLVTLAALLGFR